MSDHAVLVPTSLGPMGGIVSEPGGPRRATLMFLQGGATVGLRSGTNAIWTRIARALAELGVTVLRTDNSCKGESSAVRVEATRGGARGATARHDVVLLGEVASWFRERTGSQELFVAGNCYGARLAIHLAARDPAISRLFLSVPFLRAPNPRGAVLRRVLRMSGSDRLDPAAVNDMRSVLRRAPVTAMVGENDVDDVFRLRDALGPDAARLELTVVPDVALHPPRTTRIQEEILQRTVGWLSATLVERSPA
ncbi:hypothetical protein BH20GEM1_BH20GEM1_21420 [soil metagenome]